jgi:hypothetical protein
MVTIECLDDRLTKWRTLRVLDKHARPGKRLERNPMQSNRTAKGADCNDAADLSKHDCEARSREF